MEREKNEGFATPVLLVSYNRPDETDKVIEALREVRPRVLYVVVDGPKPTEVDRARVAAVREIVLEKISWNCDL
jgi:GT2 family glycosyltransferase